jgi:hypothetical protein
MGIVEDGLVESNPARSFGQDTGTDQDLEVRKTGVGRNKRPFPYHL